MEDVHDSKAVAAVRTQRLVKFLRKHACVSLSVEDHMEDIKTACGLTNIHESILTV